MENGFRENNKNLAVWSIDLNVPCDALSEGSKSPETEKGKIMGFLTKNGISQSEITQLNLRVTDRQAEEYGSISKSSKSF